MARALVVVAALTASAPTVRADERVVAAQEQARREMEAGVAETARGDHASALGHFLAAQALVPEANLPHRFAAEAYELLGRYAEAVASYETYLRVRPNVKDADRVRARIVDLREQHLDGRIEVLSTPAGAWVTVDDERTPRGQTPLTALPVAAGTHEVRVRLEGHRDVVLAADVRGGSRVVLQASLEPLPRPFAPAPRLPATAAGPTRPLLVLGARGAAAGAGDAPKVPVYGRPWFWIGTGALVAAGVVGAVLVVRSGAPPATQGGTYRFPEGS